MKKTASAKRFVLLDRDGTLIVEREYLADPAGVALLPGAAEGLRRLRALGCGLAVVTNQSGVGRGFFTLRDVDAVHARLVELLLAEGVELDGIFLCPHAPEANCACRKPRPGLAEEAARALGFSLAEAFVVGDKAADIELGRAIGAYAILVRTGYGAEVEQHGCCLPDAIVDDLIGAAEAVATRIRTST